MSEVPELEWFEAPDLASAASMLDRLIKAGTPARIIAGGTDLIGAMKDRLQDHRFKALVHIKNVPRLNQIVLQNGHLRIGAGATLSEVEQSPLVREKAPLLSMAASHVASPQIRNMGTLGGNINQRPRCWYYRNEDFNCYKKGGDFCFAVTGENQYHAVLGGELCYIVHPSDTAPALVALDATARIVGPGGEKEIPFGQYFISPRVDVTRENVLGPAEILAEVLIPEPRPNARGVYLKVRERQVWDFATLAVAVQVASTNKVVEDARIVLGGVAPVPFRVPRAEDVLRGKPLTETLAQQAGEAAFQGARPMTYNAYKVDLGKELVKRALLAAV